jgi:hypothetical protein
MRIASLFRVWLLSLAVFAALYALSGSDAETGRGAQRLGQPQTTTQTDESEPESYPVGSKFTIVMLQYGRLENIPTLLQHYRGMKLVAEIVLVWNNLETQPSESVRQLVRPVAGMANVKIIPQTKNTLNNRFFEYKSTSTDCIAIIDDDLLINADDLATAYEFWSQHPRQIIGLEGRGVFYDKGLEFWKYIMHTVQGRYSIVIGKFMMMHRNHLKAYSLAKNYMLHGLVDETTCDDITINAFVSERTGLPPIMIDAKVKDLDNGSSVGLSHKTGHLMRRKTAVNWLVQYYGRQPLVESDFLIKKVGGKWEMRHSATDVE